MAAAEVLVEVQFSWLCPEGGNTAQGESQQQRGVVSSNSRARLVFIVAICQSHCFIN